MAISISDTLEQSNRNNTVRTSEFFHLINTSDINFSVEKIAENSSDTAAQVFDARYVIKDINSSPIGALQYLQNNDIVRWTGSEWVIHKSVNNAETNFGIIYDKRTQLFYQYDPANGWKPLLRSGKIDGGTFS
jgi:uncharacterized protein (DUF2344 family)